MRSKRACADAAGHRFWPADRAQSRTVQQRGNVRWRQPLSLARARERTRSRSETSRRDRRSEKTTWKPAEEGRASSNRNGAGLLHCTAGVACGSEPGRQVSRDDRQRLGRCAPGPGRLSLSRWNAVKATRRQPISQAGTSDPAGPKRRRHRHLAHFSHAGMPATRRTSSRLAPAQPHQRAFLNARCSWRVLLESWVRSAAGLRCLPSRSSSSSSRPCATAAGSPGERQRGSERSDRADVRVRYSGRDVMAN